MASAEMLGKSLALGFWTRHSKALEALYELSDAETFGEEAAMNIDAALVDIWRGERNEDIRAIIKHAEADGKAFLGAAKTVATKAMDRRGCPYKLDKFRDPDKWTIRARLVPTAKKERALSLGVGLDTDAEGETFLYVDVTPESSGAIATKIGQVISSWNLGARHRGEYWDPCAVAIGAVPLKDFIDQPSGALDFDLLVDALQVILGTLNNEVMAAVRASVKGGQG